MPLNLIVFTIHTQSEPIGSSCSIDDIIIGKGCAGPSKADKTNENVALTE